MTRIAIIGGGPGSVLGEALNGAGDCEAALALDREASANAARVFGDDSRIFGESLSAVVPLEIASGSAVLIWRSAASRKRLKVCVARNACSRVRPFPPTESFASSPVSVD